MHDPAIIEAAARVLQQADLYDTRTPPEYREIAEVVLAVVTPLIEATALEQAASVVEDCTADSRDGAYIAARIRALKQRP